VCALRVNVPAANRPGMGRLMAGSGSSGSAAAMKSRVSSGSEGSNRSTSAAAEMDTPPAAPHVGHIAQTQIVTRGHEEHASGHGAMPSAAMRTHRVVDRRADARHVERRVGRNVEPVREHSLAELVAATHIHEGSHSTHVSDSSLTKRHEDTSKQQ
jgi:hypothetical protein